MAADRIPLAKAERIITEYSYKYTLRGIAELAARAGLTVQRYLTDEDDMFSLQFCTATVHRQSTKYHLT